MDPITAAEIYRFYVENKLKFSSQSDLVETFLLTKLRISFIGASPEVQAIFKQHQNKTVSSLRKLLAKIKITKKTTDLDQIIFITAQDCNLLSQLAQKVILTIIHFQRMKTKMHQV